MLFANRQNYLGRVSCKLFIMVKRLNVCAADRVLIVRHLNQILVKLSHRIECPIHCLDQNEHATLYPCPEFLSKMGIKNSICSTSFIDIFSIIIDCLT